MNEITIYWFCLLKQLYLPINIIIHNYGTRKEKVFCYYAYK